MLVRGMNFMKRVLVIGANSYIGKKFYEFANSLSKNLIHVDLVSAANGSWEKVDFSLYDSVLHLSAIVHKHEKKSMEKLYEKVNYSLPVEVAFKAKKCHVKQFIFMSTAAVYGSKVKVITKDTIPQPDTLYGKSKYEAEQKIIDMSSDEFKVAIIRSPMVYGYGCKGNFQTLVKLAKAAPIFPDIPNKRSMIYIENLCEFIRMLIDNEEVGYFYPQNNEYVCTSETVRIINECMGRRLHFTKIFNPLIRLLVKKIPYIGKVFGDFIYEQKLIDKMDLCENKYYDFADSISRSLLE